MFSSSEKNNLVSGAALIVRQRASRKAADKIQKQTNEYLDKMGKWINRNRTNNMYKTKIDKYKR